MPSPSSPSSASRTSTLARVAVALGAVLALAVASLQLVTGGPAYAVDNASIAGTVTKQAGGNESGICVTVYTAADHDFVDDTETDAGGKYTFGGLAAGSYKVQFEDCVDGSLAEQWYSNQTTFEAATTITLTAGQARTGVNAALAAGGTVTGTVTVPTGYSAAGVCVFAFNSPGDYSLAQAYIEDTDHGAYSLGGLPAGPVRLEFLDCSGDANGGERYVREWYDDKPSYAMANPITVVAGGTVSGKNAALSLTGSIFGVVTGQNGFLPGVCVSASDDDGDNYGFATTDEQGRYTIVGLTTGSVVVHFSSCTDDGPNVIEEYYNNKATYEQANPVPVETGQVTTGVDAELAQGGSITGTVTKVGGQPQAGFCVTAYTADGDELAYATTTSTGAYTLRGLRTGSVRVGFSDCVNGEYAYEYFNDKMFFGASTPVAVTAPGTTSGINAELALAGKITGKVTSAVGGAPLEGICVSAHDANQDYVGTDETAADGTYTIGGLPAMSYKVEFDSCDDPSVTGEWWNDKPSFATADSIDLIALKTRPNVNAVLAAGTTPPTTAPPTGTPTTTAPTTGAPTTMAPTTGAPTTMAPTTGAPTTTGPTTGAPTTTAPTTGAPTTMAPTTGAPTTTAPTTGAPTTGAPTTRAPTTGPPTAPPTTPPPTGPSSACIAAVAAQGAAASTVTADQAKLASLTKKLKKVKKASGPSSARAKKAKKSVAKAKAALKTAQAAAAAALATKTASC